MFFFLFLGFLGCKNRVSEKNLHLINGYWEIKAVILASGKKIEYGANTMVDYWVVKDKKGFKKKVSPKLNGSYVTSDDAIPFRVTNTKEGFYLNFKNGDTAWREKLLALEPDTFTVEDAEKNMYLYQRYQALDLGQ